MQIKTARYGILAGLSRRRSRVRVSSAPPSNYRELADFSLTPFFIVGPLFTAGILLRYTKEKPGHAVSMYPVKEQGGAGFNIMSHYATF